eukprot:97135-Pyramimonas_sp.AAC.2
MTDQSDAVMYITMFPGRIGLNTDTAQLAIKTLLSRLITVEFNSPANSLQAPYARKYAPEGSLGC